jgi:hypothetical protein
MMYQLPLLDITGNLPTISAKSCPCDNVVCCVRDNAAKVSQSSPPSVCQFPVCWPALTSGWRGWYDSPAHLELLVGWDDENLLLPLLMLHI